MYLIINTADNENITIILAASTADFYVKRLAAGRRQSEKLLPLISAFLKQKKAKLKDVKGIAAVSGPGGFTSLRIGIVCANALAYALGVPAVGVAKSEFSDERQLVAAAMKKLAKGKQKGIVLPFYESEPNITKSKKRGIMS